MSRGTPEDEGARSMSNAGGWSKVAGFSDVQKRAIFNKTGGKCVYCGKALVFENYGLCHADPTPDSAWEVDHWIPKSWFTLESDANFDSNYEPVCCACNDEKSDNYDGGAYLRYRGQRNIRYNPDTVRKYQNGHPSWAYVKQKGLTPKKKP